MEITNKNPKIIMLAGKARAGKDTTASFIKEYGEKNNLKVINLQFSFYIKYYAKLISSWDGSEETKPRTLLQQLGTDIIRDKIDNYKKYLSNLEYNNAIVYAYRDLSAFSDIITNNKLFNAGKILQIAKEGDIDTAISLLFVEKASYNDVDLIEMKSLYEYLNNLPEVGKKEEVKGGLFSSGGLRFVCSCGCKNNPEVVFCADCG